MSNIRRYANVVFETNPAYWIIYAGNKIRKRNEKDIEKYKNIPSDCHFDFLRINKSKRLSDEQKDAIMALAESICEYRYAVFGVEISDIRKAWSSDPETGYVWDNIYYAEMNKIASNSKDNSIDDDIKVSLGIVYVCIFW